MLPMSHGLGRERPHQVAKRGSPRVNKPENDDPPIIEPIELTYSAA